MRNTSTIPSTSQVAHRTEVKRKMAHGLVYLRPVPIVFLRTEDIRLESAQGLWSSLRKLLNDHELLDRVDRAFGLLHGSRRLGYSDGQAHYSVAVETTMSLPLSPQTGLREMTLPGGAYIRERHTAGVETLADGFDQLCESSSDHTDIVIDRMRPLVEVFNFNGTADFEKANIDICLPVSPRLHKQDGARIA